MSAWQVRKFWQETGVEARGRGFGVTLDGRPLRTPAKAYLVVPSEGLARAVAAEWDAVEEVIQPEKMPVTRLVNVALDKVAATHGDVTDMLAEYGDADLTCYRATDPAGLVARQAEVWDPFLDWAAETLGARLVPVAGVMHQPQSPEALARLRTAIAELDALRLAAFHELVTLSGSLVLAFATLRGHASAEEAWNAARVDEDWQIAQWGEDEEAMEQAARKRADFLRAARVLALLDGAE
ncbi:MAG: ATPase [Rhodobacterales bacterium]|nr:MAG: ATPase [Rhodobacterales bacterium]